MKDTSIEVAGALQAAASNKRNGTVKPSRLLPAGVPARSQPAALAPVSPIEPELHEPAEKYDGDDDNTDGIKERFQLALIGHCKAESSLSVVVAEMIGEDIDRDTAIEWGIEAGLSESYVQSTVSRLYIELTGERKKKVGGGRKPNKGAAGFAERAMKACDDDTDKALALLLAARRTLEGWIKKGTVDSNLKKLRAKSA
jgi:hypothetical protein